MAPINTTDRLAKLRALMSNANIQAYLVPSEDAHQSEYIAASDARRAHISGFTGSAGHCAITATKAALWTDGRYFLQASRQLDANWALMKFGLPDTPTREQWLVAELPAKSRVAIDPKLISIQAAHTLRAALEAKGHTVVALESNLIDEVWGAQRPPVPRNQVTVLPIDFAGKPFTTKLQELRTELAKPVAMCKKPPTGSVSSSSSDADKEKIAPHGLVLTALDDIAWLFNLRGSDINYNPVFFSYAVISQEHAWLWADEKQVSDAVRTHLAEGKVTLRPYTALFDDVKSQVMAQAGAGARFLVDARCNWALVCAIGEQHTHMVPRNPVTVAKGIKNATEIAGFRECHLRDGRALVEYFAWLEDQVAHKGAKLDEVDAADALERERAKNQHFVGLSFDTISSTGPNGAIIHYKPEKPSAAVIDPKAIYLCDSGAQYFDGTTDVTRTLHFEGAGATATAFEKLAYTRVLQGHIALSRAVFPVGTSGFVLDVMARSPLWSSGLDFRHGTGHGVGHFLNVHEGPHSISPRPGSLDVALAAGMTVTNEPGYYHDGDAQQPGFGIRIENILVIKKVATPHNFGGTEFLGFENVTFVPMERRLIDKSLLCPAEVKWIDEYHAECWTKLAPLLKEGSLAHTWLRRATQPL